MSDTKLDKDLFELHMKNITSSMDRMEGNQSKLFDRQDKMNVTLAKNTVIVEEHHVRSTRMEDVQSELIVTVQNMSNALISMQRDITELDDDVKPIKKHIVKLNRVVGFMSDLPKSIKFVVISIGCILLLISLINGTLGVGQALKIFIK